MRKFEFSNEDNKAELLSVEINQNVFSFNPKSLSVVNACNVYKQKLIPILNKIQNNEDSEEDADHFIISSCILIEETVNQILGHDASFRIFHERNIDFHDYEELITFLLTVITEYYKLETEAYGKHTVTAVS